TKTGFEILQVALILGVLGDILLRATPWGLNVLLFNSAFAAGMIMILYRRAPELMTKQTIALFGALIFFASMFAWRDAIELRIADTFAIIAILSVLFLPKMKVTTQIAGVFHYGAAFLWSSFNAAFGTGVLLGSDITWKNLPKDGWRKHTFSVARGLAIAAPLVLIFGGLFMAADAAYEGWVQRVFNIKPEIVFTHVLLFSLFSWMSAGYLRGVIINGTDPVGDQQGPAKEESDPNISPVDNMRAETGENASGLPNNMSILEHINISDAPHVAEPAKEDKKAAKPWEWANIDNTMMPPVFTLGAVEVGVILGIVNLLFLSFVIVQVPYLFGGMDLVQNTPDFKLAEYARRGFGELVTVSALVLPMLLTSHWLIRKENPFAEKLFRVLAGVQIALLFVIMASAVQRLVLLTGNLGYGLTTVRLYPMIFMVWLAVVFVWFGATVLRGTRQHFAWGALWSAFLILGATHVLNPDEFIVKTNIALMKQGRDFDARYNSNLSDDALPVLINSFVELDENAQRIVLRSLAGRNCRKHVENDLRNLNYSRERASEALWPYNDTLAQQVPKCSSDEPNNLATE
ncbi:MAG: DUF4173 domain-containing protein, partial [Acidobacteriota bacterium]